MDLIYILKVLYRKIWIIIIIPLIAGVSAYFFTKNIEKKYKSVAQLATGFTTNNRVQLTKENFDYMESRSNFENLVEMMKSDLIGSMVTYSLLLHDLEEEPFRAIEIMNEEDQPDSIKSTLARNIESFKLLSSYNEFENSIIWKLDKKKYAFNKWIKDGDLTINRIKDTDFVKVEFISENPFLSAFVVNKLCEEYIRYNAQIKNAVTEESLVFFANEVEKKKKQLDDITKQLNDFKNSSQVFNYNKESDSKLAQLTDYEIKYQEEENKLSGLKISLKSVDSKIATLLAGGEQSSNSKLIEIREKINELNKIYTEGGSTDKDLETLIGDLRNQLQLEMKKLDAASSKPDKKPKSLSDLKIEKEDLELEIAIANSNLESIKGKVNALKGNVSTIGSKEYTITSLERERENAFKDYTNYVDKLNEAKSKSLLNGNSKLMITGQPNPKPEPSKRLILIAISGIGSFFMCIGFIVMMEFFDYRLKTPDKFERITKIKLLGYLSYLSAKGADFFYKVGKDKEGKEAEHMINLLRKIRFNIENSRSQVILISSPNKGDGKSFFIKSLAQSLSLLGKRVLLMDTNFRNNSLSQLIVGNRMLQKQSEYKLLNDANINVDATTDDNETSRNIIFPTSDKNVDIIASRRGLESPSEMFAGKSFTALVDSLRVKYDYVLMEGPSLNDYSDTKELTQFADGIISVFSAQSTLMLQDKESIRYLKSLNGKFLGGILNFVREEEVKL